MICPECQHENVDTAKFCNECGFRFPVPESIASEKIVVPAVEADDEAVADSTMNAEIEPQVEQPAEENQSRIIVEAEDDFEEFDYATMGDIDVSADSTVPIPELPIEEEIPPAATTAVLDGLDNILAEEYISPVSKWRTGDTMQMEPVNVEDNASKNKKFSAPEVNLKLPKASRRIFQGILVLLLGVALVGFAGYRMELWGGKSVPNVVGMAEADAIFVLEGKGFVAKSMQTKSDDTEGLVLMTDPAAGGRQDLGKEIIIHVAAARVVPDVVGKSKDDALAQLTEQGFENVTVKTRKSDEKAGAVLEIQPKAGEKGKAATPVTVHVSEPYSVPEVLGKYEDEALKLIKDEKLKVEVVDTYTDDMTENTVISTNPAPKTAIKSGKTVVVEVARSRATRLVNATYDVIGPGADIQLGGINYHVDSIDSVKYEGNNVTSYTLTASPFAVILGERATLGSRQISGTLTWTDDAKLASADPGFKSL